jgi:thioredoxin 1
MNHTDDELFYKDVVERPGLTLVDFWADWCAPCRSLKPKVGKISEQFKDELTVFNLDIEVNPKTAELYKIKSIPTLLLFKDGLLIDRLIGNVAIEDLEEFIEKGISNEETQVPKETSTTTETSDKEQ